MTWDKVDQKYFAAKNIVLSSKRICSPESVEELMGSSEIDYAFSVSEYTKLILDSFLERISTFGKEDQIRSLEILNRRRKNKTSGWFNFGGWLSDPANFNREFHESFISIFGKDKYLSWVLRGYNFPDLVNKSFGSIGYYLKKFPDRNVVDLLIFVSKNMTHREFCGYKKSHTHKRVEALVDSLNRNTEIRRVDKIVILSNILVKIVVDVDETVRKKICEAIGMEVLNGKTYKTLGRQLDKAAVIFGVFDE